MLVIQNGIFQILSRISWWLLYRYLIYKANKLNISTPIIKVAREVNESMSKKTIKYLRSINDNIENSNGLIYGLTFKEDTNDIRNSKNNRYYKKLH